jgi:nifR3 family TIM-barrel protein
MVSARALVDGQQGVRFGPDEPVRSVQLYGVDPRVVDAAMRRLLDAGADHVDLNFGCPMPKVTRRGGGAALPVHRRLFRAIVRAAVRAAGTVPVTVKMRIGVDAGTETFVESGRIAADEGAVAVALHARTAEQFYSGAADWDAIARLKAALPGVPVLGNGDIWSGHDALRMLASTGCDGVVVGRGCLGRPWLFAELAAAFRGDPAAPAPLLGEVVAVLRRHARLLAGECGDERLGVRDLRKHVGWYLTGYPVARERLRELTAATSLAELDAALDRLDPALAVVPGADTAPRGHLAGPRRVTLPDRWRETADDELPPAGADLVVTGG